MSGEITKVYSGDAVKRVAMKLHAKPHVVPTGLPTLDRDFMLWGDRRGIPRGQYVIIGGASNIGKSRFSSYLLRQAVKYGEPAALVSLEDSLENLLAMYFMELDAVPFRDWLPSRWTKEHTKALATKVKSVAMESAAPLYVTSAESRSDLSAVLENIYELVEAGVKFLVVDHLQLVKSEGFRSDYERSVYVSETIREVKAKTGITIVGLSQLKRTAAEDHSRRAGHVVNGEVLVVIQQLFFGSGEHQNRMFVDDGLGPGRLEGAALPDAGDRDAEFVQTVLQ